jgi:hypothetical protein
VDYRDKRPTPTLGAILRADMGGSFQRRLTRQGRKNQRAATCSIDEAIPIALYMRLIARERGAVQTDMRRGALSLRR